MPPERKDYPAGFDVPEDHSLDGAAGFEELSVDDRAGFDPRQDAGDSQFDGSWRQEFSGKELFRHVRGWLHTKPPAVVSPSELDIDVARAVAKYQVDHGTVPVEITELRIAVREKAGL